MPKIINECRICKKPFLVYPSQKDAITNCSKECSAIHRSNIFKGRANTWAHKCVKERLINKCEVCGKEIFYRHWEINESGKKRYCSTQCSGKSKIGRRTMVDLQCAICSKHFKRRRDHVRDISYCSRLCASISHKKVNPKCSSNKEYMSSYLKKYNAKNSSRFTASKRQWGVDNRNKKLEIQAKYRRQNRHRIAVHAKKRKAAFKDGDLTTEQWIEVLNRYNFTCLCCGKAEPEIKITLDHIVPIVKGGRHTKDNVQPLCKGCNSSKNSKTVDFRAPIF